MSTQKGIWQSRYYTIPRVYMSLVGIWPYHTIRNRCLSFALTFTFSLSILIPQVSYLLTGSINLDDLFECVPSILITIIFSFKLASIMVYDKNVKICLKKIEEDWLSLNTDIEKDILQRCTEFGSYVTTFYAGFMLMTLFFYLLKPVILILLENDISNVTTSSMPGASKLPFRVEYGERLHQYFYPIMIHCCLAIFAHVFTTTAVDSLYYTLIQHACGMFSIIGYTLENIGKDNDSANLDMKLEKIKDDNYNKALYCLRKHLHVIQFAELIESTFRNIFLVSVSFNMVAGSLCGIQVIMNLSNARDIAAPMAIYIAQLTHMFLQFWQAQFLLDYSVIPYESICRGKWYYTSQRCQKIFLLIMNRAMSPCKITAGKIMTLSIETFGTVLKTSMSYFTILRSFQ